jgi:hypothetical protein
VLPEDDANRQLANGFWKEVDSIRQMYVLPVAGGWNEVLNLFKSVHVVEMDRWEHRLMILLIDFDGQVERLNEVRAAIPEHLSGRVFVLGAWSEPENLRAALGGYETIGSGMAGDCRDKTDIIWGHNLLKHNAEEVERLRERVRPILFPTS